MYIENIERLPDAYYKGSDGNNYKLLRLAELVAEAFVSDMENVDDSADLTVATGKTLDLLGETVGQLRGKLNDEQYRLLILAKIAKNNCQGDYNSVISLLTQMFNCNKGDIVISDAGDPLKVTFESFPLEILINAGFTGAQAVAIIETVLPVCVKLSDINFQGTFEFGDVVSWGMLENRTYNTLGELTYEELEYYDYDVNKGFANDAATTGGTLGLSQEADTFDLPI